MTEKFYMDTETGEVVFTHAEAMELFRQGHDISIFRRFCYTPCGHGEWRFMVRWEH